MDVYTITLSPDDLARLEALADQVRFSTGRPEWPLAEYVRWALSQASVAAGLPAWPRESTTTGYRLITGVDAAVTDIPDGSTITLNMPLSAAEEPQPDPIPLDAPPPAVDETESDDDADPVSGLIDFDVMPPGVALKEKPPERRNKKGGVR